MRNGQKSEKINRWLCNFIAGIWLCASASGPSGTAARRKSSRRPNSESSDRADARLTRATRRIVPPETQARLTNSEDINSKWPESDDIPFPGRPEDYKIEIEYNTHIIMTFGRVLALLLERHGDLNNDIANTCRPAPGWYANVGFYRENFGIAEQRLLMKICYNYIHHVLNLYNAEAGDPELRRGLQARLLMKLRAFAVKVGEHLEIIDYNYVYQDGGNRRVDGPSCAWFRGNVLNRFANLTPIIDEYNRNDVPTFFFEANLFKELCY